MSKRVTFPQNQARSSKFILSQLETLLEKHQLDLNTQLLIGEQLPTQKSIQSNESEYVMHKHVKGQGRDTLRELHNKLISFFGQKVDQMEEEIFSHNIVKRERGVNRKCLSLIVKLIKVDLIFQANKIFVLKWIHNLLAIEKHLQSDILSKVVSLVKPILLKLGFKILNLEDPSLHKSKKNINSKAINLSEEQFRISTHEYIQARKQKIMEFEYQICRMCESYVKVKNMNAHLNLCEYRHQKRYFQEKLIDKGKEIFQYMKTFYQKEQQINQLRLFFYKSYRLLGQKRIIFCLMNDVEELEQIIEGYAKSQEIMIRQTLELFTKYLQILKAKIIEGYQSDEEGKSHPKSKSKSSKSKHFNDHSRRSINISISQKNSQKMIQSQGTINSDTSHLNSASIKYKLDDFQILQKLGQGSYSEVFLVRKKNTQDLFAMKVLIFEDVNLQSFEAFKKEQKVYKNISGGYNVKLYYSFSESGLYFLILDYAPGGSLRQFLEQEVYLSEKDAKFYIANLILAVNTIHQIGIIHRDLKPENIVIDQSGYLILTDFNLAKIIRQRQNSEKKGFFGSPDYIAPEVLLGEEDNLMRDIFSVGIIAYQILTGSRPFSDVTPQKVFENILQGDISWPEIGEGDGMISQSCQHFLIQMLCPDPKKRLGFNGLDQIKNHRFFNDFNWDSIDQYQPYFIPEDKQIPSQQNLSLRQGIQNHKKKTSIHIIGVDPIIRYDILKNRTNKNVRSHRNSRFKIEKQLQALKDLGSEGNFKLVARMSFDELQRFSSDEICMPQMSCKDIYNQSDQIK